MDQTPHKPLPLKLLRNPLHFLSFGFGSGYAPVAPGTFGTLAGIPVYVVLSGLSVPIYGVALLLMLLLGIGLCAYTSRALGVHDHKAIVWDEVVGYAITMFSLQPTGFNIIAGFALFRLFDVWKPWPIHLLDRHVHGGLGIMVDDVLAGVYAALAMQALLYVMA